MLEEIDLDNVYLSHHTFKIYENVIIHYTEKDISSFHQKLAEILSNTIITFYEKTLIKRLLTSNYFYFSELERKQIESLCLHTIQTDPELLLVRKDHIYFSCLEYIVQNRSMILDGFVRFRLQEYVKFLDMHLDIAVNSFLIEKEYSEFINLLKMYIASTPSSMEEVHLIYQHKDSILMDQNKEIIPIQDNLFNAKYLSDITFSSNDYSLNTLLTLLPRKNNRACH